MEARALQVGVSGKAPLRWRCRQGRSQQDLSGRRKGGEGELKSQPFPSGSPRLGWPCRVVLGWGKGTGLVPHWRSGFIWAVPGGVSQAALCSQGHAL